jgi:hypothetical protein
MDARTKSDYFPHTTLRDWFMYLRRCVYCAVRIEFLNANEVNFRLCEILKVSSVCFTSSLKIPASKRNC